MNQYKRNSSNDLSKQQQETINYRTLMSSLSNSMNQNDEIIDPSLLEYLMELEPDIQNLLEANVSSTFEINTNENEELKINNELDKLNQVENISINENQIINDDSDYELNKDYETTKRITRSSYKKNTKREIKYHNDDIYEYGDSCTYEDTNNYDENSTETDDLNYNRHTTSINRSRNAKRIKIENNKNCDIHKKGSNKEAATRYRMKKLNEKDLLFETKMNLEKQNDDVQKKIDHVQTEINYIKNLLVQLLLTKGILGNMKNNVF